MSLARAHLSYLLAEPGPFTLFAPIDSAFFQATGFMDWRIAKDISSLKAILACHVVPGQFPAALLVRRRSLRSLRGEHIEIRYEEGIRVEGARIIRPDIFASNGIIHIVDQLVLPGPLEIVSNRRSRPAEEISLSHLAA